MIMYIKNMLFEVISEQSEQLYFRDLIQFHIIIIIGVIGFIIIISGFNFMIVFIVS